ncbi:uncharacterized protein C8R40DRAFT_1071653 [Lentinula edodes]|uniref:uncharacterized protein n=1 Tax=Lentinula edodes TaxID=5353 RepID=UPI001E8E08F5|nr:uncharacterized protein C8R40DRAFT_1071653 [Lentinula edodes]KAH7872418.1 hypothetical protein C8R40DRAFT_1071653 [Lentinula edodes]
MTIKKSVRRRFIRSIASPPPVIDASLPLSPEVIEALDVLHLMTRKSPESLEILGKIWVFSFALRWPLPVHQATTQFLVVFFQILNGSRIVSTWSTAIAEFPRWSVSSNPNSQSLMGNQGLILAATVMFIQPLPVIQEVDVILSYIRRSWNRCLDATPFSKNNDIGINLLLSFEYLAKFFLRSISGDSKWIVKVLDCGLLCLLVKTLASGSLPTFCHTPNSVHTVLEEIIHQLLLNIIFILVVRGCVFKAQKIIWALEDSGSSGQIRRVNLLRKEYRDSLSNESCPGNPLPGIRSKLCGACRATAYCSKYCQKQDWQAGHKKSCKKQFSKVAAFLYLNTLFMSH